MKQEEINKKIKTWKIVYWITLLPITLFGLFLIYIMIAGECYFKVCSYGITALIETIEYLGFMAIVSAIPMILIILDIILLITSKIRIEEYKNINDLKEEYNQISKEEIQKKLKKWKIILIITLIPIIILLVYAFWRGSFYEEIMNILFISTIFVLPIILEILDIIFLMVSIIKIIKYKQMLNMDFKS